MSKTNIYILKLEAGCYYVGKSDDVKKRVDSHFKGKGCEWTKRYKPIKLIKTIKNTSHFDEDKNVKILMSKHGIDKVRGGSYSQIKLSEEEISLLKRELNSASNKCLRCGRDSHFIKDCYATTDANGDPIKDKNESSSDNFSCKKRNRTDEESSDYDDELEEEGCSRCGRDSHPKEECYAKTDIEGYEISDDEDSEEYSDDDLSYSEDYE